MAPWGVYVHIPWCRSRCPYCAFDISTRRDPPHAAYTDAVLREWRLRRPLFDGPPATVFFGGGTPSLCPPEEIARILEGIGPVPGAEVSLEANPDRLDVARLRAYRAAGVTRLSVGVQSFDPDVARRLGRRRDSLQAADALQAAREAGFASISLDLMFAAPHQTVADFRADLAAALGHRPDHVSLYGLTIEEGTPFSRAGYTPADEDVWREMYDDATDILGAHGISRYEVSNFARDGHRCTHNEHYWRARHWAGLGVGAHAWWPDGTRAVNVRTAEAFLAADDPLLVAERPAPEELAAELVGSTLRHVDGVDRALLRRHTGLDVRVPASVANCVDITDDAIRLRPAGFALADAIARRLVGAFVRDHGRATPSSGPVSVG
jgi:oxygen-independent coproporphyrinogen-3 oxidase